MPTCLLFSAHITFTMTLHCIISLTPQSYSYKECTRQDIWAAQQLQRAGKSNPFASTTGCFNYRFLLCYSAYPCSCSIWNCSRKEMWDEELTWEFLFPYPAHYLQQSKGFTVLFLSLLFNMHAAQGILKERRVAGETEISPWAFPDP